MKTIRVRVTKKDIERGEPMDCYLCPLARALRRYGFKKAVVGPDSVWLGAREVLMPKAACTFTERFDEGKPVEPFSFTLRIPNPKR